MLYCFFIEPSYMIFSPRSAQHLTSAKLQTRVHFLFYIYSIYPSIYLKAAVESTTL